MRWEVRLIGVKINVGGRTKDGDWLLKQVDEMIDGGGLKKTRTPCNKLRHASTPSLSLGIKFSLL